MHVDSGSSDCLCPNPSPLCHYASNQQFEWKKGLRGPRIAEDSTISTANSHGLAGSAPVIVGALEAEAEGP